MNIFVTNLCSNILNALKWIFIIFVFSGWCLFCWHSSRFLNWHFGYENKVKQEIEELDQRVQDIERVLYTETEKE